MLSLINRIIRVTIVDDSEAERCDVCCEVDWSSAETMALASQRIKDGFGDKMQLEYLDLSHLVARRRARKLFQEIKNKDLPLPLLLIDGRPRVSGLFDIRMLVEAISTELEVKYG